MIVLVSPSPRVKPITYFFPFSVNCSAAEPSPRPSISLSPALCVGVDASPASGVSAEAGTTASDTATHSASNRLSSFLHIFKVLPSPVSVYLFYTPSPRKTICSLNRMRKHFRRSGVILCSARRGRSWVRSGMERTTVFISA